MQAEQELPPPHSRLPAHDRYYNNPDGQKSTETQITYQRSLDRESPDVVAEEKGPRDREQKNSPGNRDVSLLSPTHVLEPLSPFIPTVSAILSM